MTPACPGLWPGQAGPVRGVPVRGVPVVAVLASLRRPRVRDGFDEVFVVEFDGAGGFLVHPAGEEGEDGEP